MKSKFLIIFSLALILGCSAKDTERKDHEVRSIDIDGKSVSIPAQPKKVVADYYVGELLKLKAPLVGADLTYVSSAWENHLEGVTDVGQSLESIAALEPDLIVTINADKVEQYSAIAPTVLIPYGTYNPEEIVKVLGKITGTQDIASQWQSQFIKSVEDLAKVLPSLEESYTIIDIWGGNSYLYGEHFGRGGYILYNKLGLKGPQGAEEDYIRKPDSYLNVTVEALPRYVGDVLLVMSAQGVQEGAKDFMENVVWADLPAVKNNQVYHLKSEDFWFTDPFSLDLQVELLYALFNERD